MSCGLFSPYVTLIVRCLHAQTCCLRWQPVDNSAHLGQDGVKGTYKVDIDVPADDWANVTKFYDILLFNTGHW